MRRPSAFTIVLGVLCAGMLGVATNIVTAAVPEVVQAHAWIAWPLVGIALLAMAEARKDPAAPIPVVVNLSSWAIRRRPLAKWLAHEVFERYQIAQRHTRAWVQAEHLIPLLDGLDEVAEEHREACVAAINKFHREYTVRLAVCSRTTDYESLRTQLRLYGTATVQPLSREQIDDFLGRAGSTVDGLRSALVTLIVGGLAGALTD